MDFLKKGKHLQIQDAASGDLETFSPKKLPGTSLKYNKAFFEVASWPPWSIPVHTVVLLDHETHRRKRLVTTALPETHKLADQHGLMLYILYTHPYSPPHYCVIWPSSKTLVLIFLCLLVRTPPNISTELEEMLP